VEMNASRSTILAPAGNRTTNPRHYRPTDWLNLAPRSMGIWYIYLPPWFENLKFNTAKCTDRAIFDIPKS